MAKSMVCIGLLSLVLLIQNIFSRQRASSEFIVESTTTCNQWNERSRLQVGDTIAYVYEAEKNSVVKIRQEDYIICNVPSPIDATKSSDCKSVVKLNKAGPNYSISGVVENNNDKIIIQVVANQRRSAPARVSALAQTLAESEAFQYSVFFVLDFVACIVLLILMALKIGFMMICIWIEESQKKNVNLQGN